MTETPAEQDRMQLNATLRVVGQDAAPLTYVNWASAGPGIGNGPGGRPDSITVSFGLIDPPVLAGDLEQMQRQAAAIDSVDLRLLGRYACSRDQAAALYDVLGQALQLYDAAVAAAAASPPQP